MNARERSFDIGRRNIECIVFNKREGISPRSRCFGQDRRQIGVKLNGNHRVRVLQQRDGKRADTRTDFKNVIGSIQRGKVNDFLQNIIVNQEVLTQSMLRCQTMAL